MAIEGMLGWLGEQIGRNVVRLVITAVFVGVGTFFQSLFSRYFNKSSSNDQNINPPSISNGGNHAANNLANNAANSDNAVAGENTQLAAATICEYHPHCKKRSTCQYAHPANINDDPHERHHEKPKSKSRPRSHSESSRSRSPSRTPSRSPSPCSSRSPSPTSRHLSTPSKSTLLKRPLESKRSTSHDTSLNQNTRARLPSQTFYRPNHARKSRTPSPQPPKPIRKQSEWDMPKEREWEFPVNVATSELAKENVERTFYVPRQYMDDVMRRLGGVEHDTETKLYFVKQSKMDRKTRRLKIVGKGSFVQMAINKVGSILEMSENW